MKIKHLIAGLMALALIIACIVWYGEWVLILLSASGALGFIIGLAVFLADWNDSKFLNKKLTVTKSNRARQEILELLAEAARRKDSQEIERLTRTLERIEN